MRHLAAAFALLLILAASASAATFTGSIQGNLLIVDQVSVCCISNGQVVQGSSVVPGTTITGLGTGTGMTGTYIVSRGQVAREQPMSTEPSPPSPPTPPPSAAMKNDASNAMLPAAPINLGVPPNAADVRLFMSGGVCSGSSGVAAGVDAAVTAGYQTIYLPAGCIYIPDANTTPADTTIVGGDWLTSIVSVANRATDSLLMGPRSRLINVGIISEHCDQDVTPDGTQKICPNWYVNNVGDSTPSNDAWNGTGFVAYLGARTIPGGGGVTTDPQGFAAVGDSTAVGADLFYSGTGAAGQAGHRMLLSGPGDYGLYCFDNTDPTDQHYCELLKEYSTYAGTHTIYIDRAAVSGGTANSIFMTDADSGGDNTSDYIAMNTTHQVSGNLIGVLHNTNTFTGDVFLANMASISGTFSGDFLDFRNAGTKVYIVDASGNLVSTGYVEPAQVVVNPPAVATVSTSQAQASGGTTLLAFASTTGISAEQIAVGTSIPLGDLVKSIVSTAQVIQAANGSFSSGQNVVPMSVTTGYAVGQQCTDVTGSGVIGPGNVIASIQAATSITLTSNTLTNSIGATDSIQCDPVVTLAVATTSAVPAAQSTAFLSNHTTYATGVGVPLAGLYDQSDAAINGTLLLGNNVVLQPKSVISFQGNASPSSQDFSLYGDASSTILNVPTGGSILFRVQNATKGTVTTTGLNSMAVGATTASTGAFTTLASSSTFNLTGIANAAGNEILCYNTSGGAVTYENAVGGCVPSPLWMKNPLELLDITKASQKLMELRPAVWQYKDTKTWGKRPYVGLYADDVAKMDPRCVDYDKSGKLENYEDRCVLAYLTATVQHQQQEIAALKAEKAR